MRNAGRVQGEMQELQKDAEQIAWEKAEAYRELADMKAKVGSLLFVVVSYKFCFVSVGSVSWH